MIKLKKNTVTSVSYQSSTENLEATQNNSGVVSQSKVVKQKQPQGGANANVLPSYSTQISKKQRTSSMINQRPMFANHGMKSSQLQMTSRQRSASNRGGSKARVNPKDKMAEIFERYGKVTQIDLSATVPRHNSTKRPSITVEHAPVANESSAIMSSALR